MNKIIDIQEATITYNSYNEPIETWANVKGLTNLYTTVINKGGKEFYAAQKLNSEITMVFKLRDIEGITNLMRVKYDNRYFSITNVIEGEFILIYAKEVV